MIKSFMHSLEKKALLLLVVFIFIKMLALNFLTPLIADDFANSGFTFTGVLRSLPNIYFRTSGRIINVFLHRSLLILPKEIFNILNAIVYTGLTLLIFKISNPTKLLSNKGNIVLYMFIFISIWLFTPVFGQVMLWLVGSVVYLWSFFLIALFLLPYHLYLSGKAIFKRKIAVIGMIIAGFIAGTLSENGSGGLILIIMAMLLYCKVFETKIKLWMVSGFIGSVNGFLFMILAPGNMVRAAHPMFIDDRSLFIQLTDRFHFMTRVIRDEFSLLIVIFIVLITIQIVLNKDWKRIFISLVYFIASIATIYAMVLSPVLNATRTMLGPTIFMIIACAISLAGITLYTPPPQNTSKFVYCPSYL